MVRTACDPGELAGTVYSDTNMQVSEYTVPAIPLFPACDPESSAIRSDSV